jgi:beta-glucanase (GH16 family)
MNARVHARICGKSRAAARETRTFVEDGYNAAPMTGHSISRCWRLVGAAALVMASGAFAATAASASANEPLKAHAASRTATVIIHPATVGRYEVIIWVRSRTKHASMVKVYVSGQHVQSVHANPWWGARVYYMLNLSAKKVTVHTVNRAPAVQVRASLILKQAASSAPQASSGKPDVTTAPTPAPAPAPTPAPVATPTLPPYSSHTTLVWQDNFAGPAGSAPNSTNWKYDTGPSCASSGCSVNTASTANADLTGNNQLAINAISTGNGGTTVAQLQTPAVFHVGEEIDANIQLPAGQGLWGGFWMLENPGAYCANPNCGEMDIMEAPEMGPTPVNMYFTLHGPISNGGTQQYSVNLPAPDLSAAPHTYGVIWTPGQLQYTFDGNVLATVTPGQLVAGSTWAFDTGNYSILLDLAVGGWPGAAPPSTHFPATMLVNWVRVYQ